VPEGGDHTQGQERDTGRGDRGIRLGLNAAHGSRGQYDAYRTGCPLWHPQHRRSDHLRERHQHGRAADQRLPDTDQERQALDVGEAGGGAVSTCGRGADQASRYEVPAGVQCAGWHCKRVVECLGRVLR